MFKLKMMAVVLVPFLHGCYQSVASVDLRKAAYYCDGVANVEYINAHFTGDEHVKCATMETPKLLASVELPKQ